LTNPKSEYNQYLTVHTVNSEDEMKIEVGKYYKRRGGGKVKVIGRKEFDVGRYPFVADGENVGVYTVNEDGSFSTYQDSFDLIEEWSEPVTVKRYVHFLQNGDGSVYTTTEDMPRGQEFFAGKLLGVKEVEFTY
jgi:hypothetical protein